MSHHPRVESDGKLIGGGSHPVSHVSQPTGPAGSSPRRGPRPNLLRHRPPFSGNGWCFRCRIFRR